MTEHSAITEARESAKAGYQAIAVVFKDGSVSTNTYDAGDKNAALDWDSFTNDPTVTPVDGAWYVPLRHAGSYRLKGYFTTEPAPTFFDHGRH